MNKLLEGLALGLLPIAQMATPQPNDLFVWLGCAAFVMVFLNQGSTFWKNISGGLQKKQPSSADQLVTTEECKERHAASEPRFSGLSNKIDSLRMEVKADMQEGERRAEERSHGIHQRINKLSEVLGEVKGQLQQGFHPRGRVEE